MPDVWVRSSRVGFTARPVILLTHGPGTNGYLSTAGKARRRRPPAGDPARGGWRVPGRGHAHRRGQPTAGGRVTVGLLAGRARLGGGGRARRASRLYRG